MADGCKRFSDPNPDAQLFKNGPFDLLAE